MLDQMGFKNVFDKVYASAHLGVQKPDVQFFADYLGYRDKVWSEDSSLAEWYDMTPSAQIYTAELRRAMEQYGTDKLMALANASVGRLRSMMQDLGIDSSLVSPFTDSTSWFLWHAAKERHLAANPNAQAAMPNANKYNPHDPLVLLDSFASTDERIAAAKAIEAMEFSQLGWELYRLSSPHIDRGPEKPPAPIDIATVLQSGSSASENLRRLVNEQPKREPGKDTTLSTFKLTYLGQQAYENRNRPEVAYPE